MLQFKISQRHGGFTLWGDYSTLKPLHSFIMEISETSIVLENEGLLPALAYDLRKAYEGQREQKKIKVWDDQVTIYGVEQVWPTFIVQVALLRTGLAFTDSSKHKQSQIFLLESFLEDSIKSAFPIESQEILHNHGLLIGTQEQLITNILGSRVSYFLSRDANTRKPLLPELLLSLNSVWDIMHARGKDVFTDGKLSPSDFEGYSWDSINSDDKYSI